MPNKDDVIAAATIYLDALVSHDGAGVPLAPECWRVEQGRNTGLGAEDIRQRLAGDEMQGITGYRDVRWYVDGDNAIAFYTLDVLGATAQIVERFRVTDSLITEIEAVFLAHREDWKGWTP